MSSCLSAAKTDMYGTKASVLSAMIQFVLFEYENQKNFSLIKQKSCLKEANSLGE